MKGVIVISGPAGSDHAYVSVANVDGHRQAAKVETLHAVPADRAEAFAESMAQQLGIPVLKP